MEQEVNGIIIDGVRYDVKHSKDGITCGNCEFCHQMVKVCVCCPVLVGDEGYFVKSEKLTEP